MNHFISGIIYLEVVAFSVLLLGALYLVLHSKYPNTYIGYGGKNAKLSGPAWEMANRAFGFAAIVNSLAVGAVIPLLHRRELLSGVVSALILTELIFLPVLVAELLSGQAHRRYKLNNPEQS